MHRAAETAEKRTPEAHLPKFKKSELEEGGSELCAEGTVLDIDVEVG